jgi:hypothetical protein
MLRDSAALVTGQRNLRLSDGGASGLRCDHGHYDSFPVETGRNLSVHQYPE